MVGKDAGTLLSTGNYNMMIGSTTGYNNVSGSKNCFIGLGAGRFSTGSDNTCIGSDAGYHCRGDHNIAIGKSGPGAGSSNYDDHRLYIDSEWRGSSSFIYGNMTTGSKQLTINAILYVDGNVWADNFYESSDINLKENINKIEDNILTMIDQLNPVYFHWKKNNKKDVGFIAQEVNKLIPILIQEKDDSLTLNYSKLSPYLVKGIQEQNKKIKDLEEKLELEKEKRSEMEKYFQTEINKIKEKL